MADRLIQRQWRYTTILTPTLPICSTVSNRTWEFLRHLGFTINSRDEFIVIRKFMEKEEFDTEYLKQELELAQHNLTPPEFEDIKEIMQENAKTSDVRRAAAFFKLIRYSHGKRLYFLCLPTLRCA